MACFLEMSKLPSSKLRMKSITEVLRILVSTADMPFSSSSELLQWARDRFPNFEMKEDIVNSAVSSFIMKYLSRIKNEIDEDSDEPEIEDASGTVFEKIKTGALKIEEMCISCYGSNFSVVAKHPLFHGGLCSSCVKHLQETAFAVGNDAKNICCTICFKPGFLILCENVNCPKSYCRKCLICYLGSAVIDQIESLDHIDLVIGGSPCNDLSLVNPARKGLFDLNGTGYLFFDFFHILNIVRRKNLNVFYLFENVAAMRYKDKAIISSFFTHEPALIDARYFSPQTRARYFWGNIPGLYSLSKLWNSCPDDEIKANVLSDCILPNVGRKAVVEKINCITTNRNSLIQNNFSRMPVTMNGEPDILWITEIEKIFGFPLHYTDTGNLGISKRRELLGRSWSVPVIKTILQPLRNFFECT